MDTQNGVRTIDFASRLRRSRGRSGRTSVASAKVTPAEHEELQAAAGAEGKALGEWAREALLQTARRPKDDVFFTELIATRMLLLNILRGLAMGEKFTPEQFGKLTEKVRAEKRKVAREVMEQYSANQPKE
jgi:hypothetical protein